MYGSVSYKNSKECKEDHNSSGSPRGTRTSSRGSFFSSKEKKIFISKMTIDLYYSPGSLPCRLILLVAAKLGIRLNLKFVDLLNNEHMRAEFLKMNPTHQIPVLADDGYFLTESRAIICYLCNAYGKDDKLYPKDPKGRGLVDQRLNFDLGTFIKAYSDYYNPIRIRLQDPDPTKFENMKQAFEYLNTFLEDAEYVAGSHLTIADIALVASTSNYEAQDFDISKYENVVRWYNKLKKELPQYREINEYGIKMMRERMEMRKKSVNNLS